MGIPFDELLPAEISELEREVERLESRLDIARGAFASIIADSDCCEASKRIARQALVELGAGDGDV